MQVFKNSIRDFNNSSMPHTDWGAFVGEVHLIGDVFPGFHVG